MDGFLRISGDGWAAPCQVNTEILLSFMELLHLNHLAPTHTANYMAAIRAFHIIYGLQTPSFRDDRVSLFLKFTKINTPLRPSVKPNIDISLIDSIVHQCDFLQHPEILNHYIYCVFLLPVPFQYSSPHCQVLCPSRQLAKEDFMSSINGAVLLIKWSKTMQDRKQSVTLPLRNVGVSYLCPIKALTNMSQLFPNWPSANRPPKNLVPANSFPRHKK